jgi:ABC-type branched-subunit amino acid transport system ATPase component
VIGRADDAGKTTGLSFDVPRGALAVLEAPNGWGKTTFLEAISGVIPTEAGKIAIFGREVQGLSSWQRVQAGLTVLQSRDNIFPNLMVEDSLTLAGLESAPEEIKPFLGRHVSDLSGGQRQKVAAACALARGQNSAAILDEPFGMLDSVSIADLQARIAKDASGVTLILMPAASQS